MPTIEVSSLEAAGRQLEEATRLYFENRDPVAIHTLVCAGYQVAADLGKRSGVETKLETQLLAGLPDDLRKITNDAIREPQNAFKHANRDGAGTVLFDPRLSEVLLMDAIGTYCQLSGARPTLFECYSKWFAWQHPTFFRNTDEYPLYVRFHEKFGKMDREEFLRMCLAAQGEPQGE